MSAADRRKHEAVVANRNSPQKHVWRAKNHSSDGRWLRHCRDHASDRQGQDVVAGRGYRQNEYGNSCRTGGITGPIVELCKRQFALRAAFLTAAVVHRDAQHKPFKSFDCQIAADCFVAAGGRLRIVGLGLAPLSRMVRAGRPWPKSLGGPGLWLAAALYIAARGIGLLFACAGAVFARAASASLQGPKLSPSGQAPGPFLCRPRHYACLAFRLTLAPPSASVRGGKAPVPRMRCRGFLRAKCITLCP